MYTYKSATGRSVPHGPYAVTVNPGLELPEAHAGLDKLVEAGTLTRTSSAVEEEVPEAPKAPAVPPAPTVKK